MLTLDHLTMLAPTLEEGIRHVSGVLGIDLRNGAEHIDMATHNRRIRLGSDKYLEVIATDPSSIPAAGPRWFGLDRADEVRAAWSAGTRLRGWVARTTDIDAVLSSHGDLLGRKRWLDNHFHFSVPADGALPMGGVLPSVIDLGGAPPTAESLEDQGCRLLDFVLEHPSPAEIARLYADLKIVDPPRIVRADTVRFSAEIETSHGRVSIR